MDFTNVDLISYLPAYLIIGVVVAYIIGYWLKISALKDNYINIVLMFVCITIAILLTIANTETKVTLNSMIYAFFYGVIIWGIATGINQTKKQLIDKKDEDTK